MVRLFLTATLIGLFIPLGSRAQGTATPETIEDHFRIYMLNEDRRSSQDKIVVTGDARQGQTAVISYWRSLQQRDPADEICNAYRWLLLGRGTYGKGASAAFERYPALSRIYLRFVEIESGTKIGKKRAEILPSQRVIPYLKVGVDRRTLLKKNVDLTRVKDEIGKGKCADVGNALIDDKWFDKDFLAKGKS